MHAWMDSEQTISLPTTPLSVQISHLFNKFNKTKECVGFPWWQQLWRKVAKAEIPALLDSRSALTRGSRLQNKYPSVPIHSIVALFRYIPWFHDTSLFPWWPVIQPLWLSSCQSHNYYEQLALQLRWCNNCSQEARDIWCSFTLWPSVLPDCPT